MPKKKAVVNWKPPRKNSQQKQDDNDDLREPYEREEEIDFKVDNDDDDLESEVVDALPLNVDDDIDDIDDYSADNFQNADYDGSIHSKDPRLLANNNEQSTKKKKKKKPETEVSWGKAAKTYYVEYPTDLTDRAEKQEEEEVLRLQKKKREGLTLDDFSLPLEDQPFSARLIQKKKKGVTATDLANGKTEPSTETNATEKDKNKDKDTTKKDLSLFSLEEKYDILMRDSPELFQLLSDFKKNISQLKTKILPLTTKVKNGEIQTSNGISFLELKFHLLLNYCINIVYYLILKAEGKPIADHPVIDELVRIRCVIDKIKPLDKKLKYQIDKLVKLASETKMGEKDSSAEDLVGNMKTASSTVIETSTSLHPVNPSALSFKPNFSNIPLPNPSQRNTGKYTVPKISATPYEDPESKRKESDKKEEKNGKNKWSSSLGRQMMEQYGEAPPELSSTGSGLTAWESDAAKLLQVAPNAAASASRDSLARTRDLASRKILFEEENFVRLQDTKAERKRRNKVSNISSLQNEFKDLEDFTDVSAIENDPEEIALKNRSLHKTIHHLDQAEKKKRKILSGDQDIPYANENQPKRRKLDDGDDLDEDAFNRRQAALKEIQDLEEDPFYREIENQHRSKAQQKQIAKKNLELSKKVILAPEEELEEGKKRKIDYKIKANKGLTPYRNKERRNPRIKHRNKYEAAMKKLPSAVKKLSDPSFTSKPYQGELTGIRTNLTKSTMLK